MDYGVYLGIPRVPPCHSKLTMINLEGKDQHFLLQPVEFLLADKGIGVESGVAQTDEDGRFTLVLQNYTGSPFIYRKVNSLVTRGLLRLSRVFSSQWKKGP